MFIRTEETPNPLSLKFVPELPIVDVPVDFPSPETASSSPLARQLFQDPAITGVFLGQNFITVSKTPDADWYRLKPYVIGILMEFLSGDKEIITQPQSLQTAEEVEGDDKEAIQQILELLEARIRPAVASDGGDIVLQKFEDGIVYLKMKGACSGCPSSTMTLKAGIENMLRYYIPDVKEVRSF